MVYFALEQLDKALEAFENALRVELKVTALGIKPGSLLTSYLRWRSFNTSTLLRDTLGLLLFANKFIKELYTAKLEGCVVVGKTSIMANKLGEALKKM